MARRYKPVGPRYVECEECGRYFDARRSDTLTCSVACRKSVSRKYPLTPRATNLNELRAVWKVIASEAFEEVDAMVFFDMVHEIDSPRWVRIVAELRLNAVRAYTPEGHGGWCDLSGVHRRKMNEWLGVK